MNVNKVTPREFQTLEAIKQGFATSKGVAEFTGYTQSASTTRLGRLHKRGLIVRAERDSLNDYYKYKLAKIRYAINPVDCTVMMKKHTKFEERFTEKMYNNLDAFLYPNKRDGLA